MLDKEVQEKFLKEAVEVAEKAEELYRQHANTLSNRNDEVPQANSYWKLSREVARCRQLSGLLSAPGLEGARLKQIIEAFDFLEVPELEEDRTFESQ